MNERTAAEKSQVLEKLRDVFEQRIRVLHRALKATPEQVSTTRKMIQEVDPFATLVLRAHLIVEAELDVLLGELSIAVNEHMGFDRKVRLVKQLVPPALPIPDAAYFTLLLSLNELRNKVVHKLDATARREKVAKLRQQTTEIGSDGPPLDTDEAVVAGAATLLRIWTSGLVAFTRARNIWVESQDELFELFVNAYPWTPGEA